MMNATISLTEMQGNAIKKAVHWFRKETKKKPMFTIAGYAGTGKTTIVRHLIGELGLGHHQINFVSFTGKAALQLSRNGNPATTIHRLIYNVEEKEDGSIKFVKRGRSELSGIKLIVVDEVSMVSKELMIDLYSFNIPILAIGDHGQLEPIGENNGLLNNPDVKLTEIHRQAQDNPIIHLSMLARSGQPIKAGNYGDAVVLPKRHKLINAEMFTRADQVLCSYNKTRRGLNKRMREVKGFTSPTIETGDKIICVRNNWENEVEGIALTNGMIGTAERVIERTDHLKELNFHPDFMEQSFETLTVPQHDVLGMTNQMSKPEMKLDRFDFAEAITVHKSQGSQWDNLVVWFEPMGTPETKRRLLYTAITRAKEKLVLIQ